MHILLAVLVIVSIDWCGLAAGERPVDRGPRVHMDPLLIAVPCRSYLRADLTRVCVQVVR